METRSGKGDFEQVMLPHLDAAHNLARWLVRDPSIAEDVVQDAYERAYRYFESFRGGESRAWLLQIVRNTAYSTLKAQRRGIEVSLSSGTGADDEDNADMDIPDPTLGPEAVLAQRQDLGALDKALNALPTAWRECLILREVEALSYKEIAESWTFRSERSCRASRVRAKRCSAVTAGPPVAKLLELQLYAASTQAKSAISASRALRTVMACALLRSVAKEIGSSAPVDLRARRQAD